MFKEDNMHSAILEKIKKIGIVPVVVLEDAKDAAPLAKALIEGGLPCAEVTFRTACAEECIKIMHEEYPEILLGAGTVLTILPSGPARRGACHRPSCIHGRWRFCRRRQVMN